MKRRSTVPIVSALAVSVLGAGVMRSLVLGQRERNDAARHAVTNPNADLSKVNSFALGLLLGGLRGPLVMALWTTSENQKTDRDLEDFDTKVELIRLLQPEFDTVHLFQIWNKAYNISVQMANVSNKYTTILDALDYGARVDRERPDDINIMAAIGNLYFDKFGGAAEKAYFSSRLQAETLAPTDRTRVEFDAASRDRVVAAARLAGASRFQLGVFDANDSGTRLYLGLPKDIADVLQKRLADPDVTYTAKPVNPGERRDASNRSTQHEPLLDAAHDVLPGLVKPRPGEQQTFDAADGSPMPHLLEFEPYPYGVSPYALAYNYFKRCLWLQVHRGARHAQLSERLISSRSPMSLEKWCEEDWYGALRAEIDLAGRPPVTDEGALNAVTADLTLESDLPAAPLFDQAVWRFNNASRLAIRAASEYEAHLKAFPDDELTYRSHIRDLYARSQLCAADALYLQAMHASGAQRLDLAGQASGHYALASNLYTRLIFRYYTEDEDAKKVLPQLLQTLKRTDVDDQTLLPDRELAGALSRLRQMHEASNYQMANSVDFKEIDAYVRRAGSRLRTLALVK